MNIYPITVKLDKEYYHSTCIVEFFWFAAAGLALTATILKVLVLKEPIETPAEKTSSPSKDK